jgi:uncharacterized protein (DUF58 family)
MAFDLQEDRDPTVFNSPLIWFFVAITLFAALLFRHIDLSLLSALVLLLMVGAKLWSLLSLSRVSCSIHLDKQRAFPQETVSVRTTVRNAKLLPVWVSIQWPWSRVLGTLEEASIAPQETGLLWYQQAQFHRRLKALRRGVYQVGPSHLCTSDFFGFFKSTKRLNEIIQIIVYPALVELNPVDLPKHDLFGTPGDQSPVKDPVYVMGIHDYQPSRPSRHIHWKASARHRRLQEKVFEPSEQGVVMMVLDVGGFEREGAQAAFEHTLEVIASLALKWNADGMAVGFVTNGAAHGGDVSAVPAGRGPRHLSAILEALARLQLRKRTGLSRIMRRSPRLGRGVHGAFFCYQNGKASQSVNRLCRKRAMPLTVFAWRLNPASPPDPHLEATGLHVIDDIRHQENEGQ